MKHLARRPTQGGPMSAHDLCPVALMGAFARAFLAAPGRSTASWTTCVAPPQHSDARALRRGTGSRPQRLPRPKSTLIAPHNHRSGLVGLPDGVTLPRAAPVTGRILPILGLRSCPGDVAQLSLGAGQLQWRASYLRRVKGNSYCETTHDVVSLVEVFFWQRFHRATTGIETSEVIASSRSTVEELWPDRNISQ